MKPIDGVKEIFLNMGFSKVEMNTNIIHLFYRPMGVKANIIALLDIPMGDELDVYEYEGIINRVKKTFRDYGFQETEFLGLLYTERTEFARQLVLDNDSHWLIDLKSMELLIYENQNNEFMEVREAVEMSLEGKTYSRYDIRHREPSERIVWFTLINTGIVIINIIIYLLVHHTSLLGETNEVLGKGALSWFVIKYGNEYYRLLTSMFLHSNFSHLINNMIMLFFVGDKFERSVGKIKYIIIYFGSGFLAGATSIVYNMINDEGSLTFSVGASGAIFGIVGGMLYVLISNKGKVEGISTRQILFFAIFSLYGGFSNQRTDNAAHIGGFIGGILLAFIIYRGPQKNKKIQEEREVHEN